MRAHPQRYLQDYGNAVPQQWQLTDDQQRDKFHSVEGSVEALLDNVLHKQNRVGKPIVNHAET